MRRKPLTRLSQRPGPVWLLDLDNTLHDAGTHIMPAINRAMTQWVAQHLALDEEEASALRVAYWRRYGATLLGMIAHHGIDPHAFLRDTHPVRELRSHVRPQPALAAALRRLPGTRVILTNAPQHYAHAVLRSARLHRVVTQVVAVEQMRFAGAFRPKPSLAMLTMVCARLGVSARRCVLVEDSPENLHAARRLGMRTVLVLEHSWSGGMHRPPSAPGGRQRPSSGPGSRVHRRVRSPLHLPRSGAVAGA